jgi:hypothetical protein
VRCVYMSCSKQTKEPLLIERNSVLFTNNFRQLPKWVCYEHLLRKTLKSGDSVAVMKNVTPIEPAWLGIIGKGSRLLSIGAPIAIPPPKYDKGADAIRCSVETRFGVHRWEIPSIRESMSVVLSSKDGRNNSCFSPDDTYRWFARFLLEGKIIDGLKGFDSFLNESPSLLTQKSMSKKAILLVSALSDKDIDGAHDLLHHWSNVDDKFLFKYLKGWVREEQAEDAKAMWIAAVTKAVKSFKALQK